MLAAAARIWSAVRASDSFSVAASATGGVYALAHRCPHVIRSQAQRSGTMSPAASRGSRKSPADTSPATLSADAPEGYRTPAVTFSRGTGT
jgi:hypothetical protein